MSEYVAPKEWVPPRVSESRTEAGESPDPNAQLKQFFHYSTKRILPTSGTENEGEETTAEPNKQHKGRRNTDILLHGSGFLKGNKYDIVSKDKDDDSSDSKQTEGAIVRVVDRYFTDKSTIRCRNCRELGHICAYCPNERTQWKVCIYCGSNDHEQYDCPNMLCYVCNQMGHKAAQCTSPRLSKCFSCGQSGHKADVCALRAQMIPQKEVELLVCLDCGKRGHAMCDKHSSLKIPWVCPDSQESKQPVLERCREELFDPDLQGDGLGLPADLLQEMSDGIEVNLCKGGKRRPKGEILSGFKKVGKTSPRLSCSRCGGDHISITCNVLPMKLHRAHDMSIRRAPDRGLPQRHVGSFRDSREYERTQDFSSKDRTARNEGHSYNKTNTHPHRSDSHNSHKYNNHRGNQHSPSKQSFDQPKQKRYRDA